MKPQEQAARERERYREILRRRILNGGLHAFVRAAWQFVEPGVPFVDGKHIGLVCSHLEAVSRGEIDNLMISQPPGTSKSTVVSVMWPVWDWLVCAPADCFMFATFDESLATRDSEKSRSLLCSTWFRILFGDLCGHEPGTCKHPVLLHSKHDKGRERSDTQGVWYNASGGLRFSTTIQSKATGWHAHKQVTDDPLKPQDVLGGSGADTRNALTRVINWYSGTMATRKADPRNFRRVITMQRLHDNDLVGYLKRTQGDKWVHLNLPMEFDPATAYKSPWGDDWRTEKGELLCPERFPVEAVEQMKLDMGPLIFAAQGNQNPSPEGGNAVQEDWLGLHNFDGLELQRRGALCVHSWDCSFKDLQSSDSVAGVELYYLPETDSYYMTDCLEGRLSFVKTLAAVESWIEVNKDATPLVEDKANGTAVINVLEEKFPELVAVSPLGSKESRLLACTPVFARKGFYLKEGAPWVEETKLQLTRFPKYGKDDIVDAISQGLSYFLQNSGGAWLKYMGKQYAYTSRAQKLREWKAQHQ